LCLIYLICFELNCCSYVTSAHGDGQRFQFFRKKESTVSQRLYFGVFRVFEAEEYMQNQF
jgi:hypothetical protein